MPHHPPSSRVICESSRADRTALTVRLGNPPRLLHKFDSIVAEIGERSQILLLAFIRKGVPALVAVMEVSEENVGPCSYLNIKFPIVSDTQDL